MTSLPRLTCLFILVAVSCTCGSATGPIPGGRSDAGPLPNHCGDAFDAGASVTWGAPPLDGGALLSGSGSFPVVGLIAVRAMQDPQESFFGEPLHPIAEIRLYPGPVSCVTFTDGGRLPVTSDGGPGEPAGEQVLLIDIAVPDAGLPLLGAESCASLQIGELNVSPRVSLGHPQLVLTQSSTEVIAGVFSVEQLSDGGVLTGAFNAVYCD
jgi:hypothetical protein